MTDEKIVFTLKNIGYEVFKDSAEPEEVEKHNQYCVYYDESLKKQDQRFIQRIIEFVFVNELEDFNELKIIESLEETGLLFQSGNYGRLKKIKGGDVVNSLTLQFVRPMKRSCIY